MSWNPENILPEMDFYSISIKSYLASLKNSRPRCFTLCTVTLWQGTPGMIRPSKEPKDIFTRKGYERRLRNLFVSVTFVNRINMRTPTQLGCYNPSLSLIECGQTLQWTLWKGYPYPKAIWWFLWWWTGYPDTIISPPSFTPIQQPK
jgi:hypothetical protein